MEVRRGSRHLGAHSFAIATVAVLASGLVLGFRFNRRSGRGTGWRPAQQASLELFYQADSGMQARCSASLGLPSGSTSRLF
jgi:hypothetical protein